MIDQFEINLAGGPHGDPVVLVHDSLSSTRFFFDLGQFHDLSKKELIRTQYAFISHTHIDHFIGFDRWLRVHIPHRKKLHLVGPLGFIEQVSARMRGYTWNLLEPDQIIVEVTEIQSDRTVRTARLSNSHLFKPLELESSSHLCNQTTGLVAQLPSGAEVYGLPLDHGTPSVAYCYQAPKRPKVRIDAIKKLALTPGPWIKELQDQTTQPGAIAIDGISYSRQELASQILEPIADFKIAYMTDIVFSQANVRALQDHFGRVDIVISETSFHHRDRDRATAKKHMTSKQAALIAASLGAREFITFHVSQIYGKEWPAVRQEAQSFYSQLIKLTPNDLAKAIEDEFIGKTAK